VPALIAPMLGPISGGLIVGYFHWRLIFFLNIPIGIVGLVMVYLHLPDYREEKTHPLDLVGLILFGSGIALLSYILEVFGEHTLSVREIVSMLVISGTLLCGYWLHARGLQFPLLELRLFAIRTFRASVNGGLFTRLGIGGVPFLLPLLYQTGLGYTPIQSGLLIMPQAIAAMCMKTIMKRLLGSIGYRGVLVSNTLIIGALLALFSTIGTHTSVAYIVLLAFLFGGFTSLQYTSMNTLVYSDIAEHDTSAASTIASTMQQMAISFGVAVAGLTTAFFLPSSSNSQPAEMIHGIHKAFWVLAALTVASTAVFASLKRDDGEAVSQRKILHPDG
jgi:MFS family permease